MRARDLVEEYTWKSFAFADPEYPSQLEGYQEAFEASLNQLSIAAKTAEEEREIKHLRNIWDSYKQDLRILQKGLPPGRTVLPQSIRDYLDELRSRIYSCYQSNLNSICAKAEHSGKYADLAVGLLGGAGAAALAVGILISLLIYRSIARPLSELAQGTRAMAEGKYFHRLDTSRIDELSQIAKHINTIVVRLNEPEQSKSKPVSQSSHRLKSESDAHDHN